MGRRRRQPEPIAEAVPGSEDHVRGWRLIQPLEGWLKDLHQASTHGNRSLFLDQVAIAHLVAFLSPALKGLRRIEDVFEHPKVRRKFKTPRMPKSTLSDAQKLFDASLLTPLINDLRERVQLTTHDPRLDELTTKLIAVDGTFFAMASRVTWALYNKPNKEHKPRKGNIRVDVHFNILSGTPEQAIVTGGRCPEYATLSANLESGCFYVLDRAYHCYQSLADILAAGSDFLVRLRGDMDFDVVEEHPLSVSDRMAGVLRCQTVRARGFRGQSALGNRLFKLVEIDQPNGARLRILTSRVDLSADMIGLIYLHRWQVELYFRWLKSLVNFRHFFSESENGVGLQIAIALIATLLLALEIGERPSVYDYAMMSHVMSGLVPVDGVTEILDRRRKERARAAARYRARRASQKTG